MNVSKLVLGTAQFGMDYGINNVRGQVTPNEVNDILTEAGKVGISFIDTASGYGNSEVVIGNSMALQKNSFKIISKYSADGRSPIEQYEASLHRLKTEKLYAYMVHNFPTYSERPEIWNEFRMLKEEGKVDHIGFSLYTPTELDYILENNLGVGIIQVPYNIFDRTFEPYFPLLKKMGVEVHTRSVFLQGLFFKDTKTFHGNIQHLKKYVEILQQYSKQNDIQIQDLALGYVLSSLADGVLIGVDSISQLRNNINSTERNLSAKDFDFIRSIEIKEKQFLSPVNW